MAERRLGWGILGCARICRRALIAAIEGSRDGELRAIASRDADRAREWAGEFGVAKHFDNYESVLAQSDVDVVYIPLPNELHRPWVIAAADAGKHVLCEKPLALDAAEAEEMAEHCRRRGVLLMEAFMWRHQARTQALLSSVRAGQIGDVRLVRSSFSFSIAEGDWRLDPARGGGALFDVGCYGVNMARLFVGSEPLAAHTMAHAGHTGVDMTLATTLRFSDDRLAVIDCSFEQPYRCEYEIVGTRGAITVPDGYLPQGSPSAIVRGVGGDAGAEGARSEMFEATDQYRAMVDAFGDSIGAGRLLSPCEDGVAQMRALDMVRLACG